MKRLVRYAIAVLVLVACGIGYWQSRPASHALDANPYASYNPYSTSPVTPASAIGV